MPQDNTAPQLLKDFAYTPPTLGQIKIGHLEWDDDKDMKLPKQDPFISVMSQIKDGLGMWIPHPVTKKLLDEHKGLVTLNRDGQFTSIPVNLPFDNLDLNFSERTEAYDNKTGRRVCSSKGAGSEFKRIAIHPVGQGEKICPGPENCVFGSKFNCGLFGRLYVQVEGQNDSDSSFIFRTRGSNSVKTLRWRLERYSKLTAGHPSALKLSLSIHGKSTRQSFGRPVYYLELALRGNQDELAARAEALEHKKKEEAAEYPRAEIETRLLELLNNGTTIDTVEEELELEDWLSQAGDVQVDQAATTVAGVAVSVAPDDLEAAIAAVAEASVDLAEPLGTTQLREAETSSVPAAPIEAAVPDMTEGKSSSAMIVAEEQPATAEVPVAPAVGLGDLRTTIEAVSALDKSSEFTGFTGSVLGSDQPIAPSNEEDDGWARLPAGFNAANFATPTH